MKAIQLFPFSFQSFSEVQAYLYVGLEDGNLLVYSLERHPETTLVSGSEIWTQQKVMLLSDKPTPCSSMLMIDHRDELLVACGNTVNILHVPEQSLDPVGIEVPQSQSVEGQIEGMVSYGDMVWYFANDSVYVTQYDIIKHQQVARLCCSPVLLTSNVVDTSSHDLTSGHLPSTRRTSSVGVEEHKCADVGRGNMRRTSSVGDYVETSKVTSILIVKDTLWIGRSNGDILIVGIDTSRSSNFQFGDVLAVLQPNTMTGLSTGPVTKMLSGVSGRIVACRKIEPKEPGIRDIKQHGRLSNAVSAGTARARTLSLRPTPFKYQFLVWEAWGSQDVNKFTGACTMQNLIQNHKSLAF